MNLKVYIKFSTSPKCSTSGNKNEKFYEIVISYMYII